MKRVYLLIVFALPRRVEEIAKKKNVSMAQVAPAWSIAKDGRQGYICR